MSVRMPQPTAFLRDSLRALLCASSVVHCLYARDAVAQSTTRAGARSPEPRVTIPVPPDRLVGVDLPPFAYDDSGYPESYEGLLVVDVDQQSGPSTNVRGVERRELEAQFTTIRRDAVWLARSGRIVDHLPNGATYEIPHGYGALKRSLSVKTVFEPQFEPHVSDDVKSYQLFPLRDIYFGGVMSFTGIRPELRLVDKERYVAFVQAGINAFGLGGLGINRTYGAFAVPVAVGGGLRYPTPLKSVGANWTTGAEVVLGFIDIDDQPDTAAVIALPGLFHEVEWTFERTPPARSQSPAANPANYTMQAFFMKVSAHPDFLGGATHSLLIDVHIGYRYNFRGPSLPAHSPEQTNVAYASEQYVQRTLETTARPRFESARDGADPAPSVPQSRIISE